jgi:hypothetical protein
MTKNPKPAKPAALKARTWKDKVRAQNEIVERLCVELGIDQAELFLRAKERLRDTCRQMMKERGQSQPSQQRTERGDA